jgi:hypothetical protein
VVLEPWKQWIVLPGPDVFEPPEPREEAGRIRRCFARDAGDLASAFFEELFFETATFDFTRDRVGLAECRLESGFVVTEELVVE